MAPPFLFNMYKILVFSNNTQKAAWRQIKNTFYYESPIPLTPVNIQIELLPLFEYIRRLTKNVMIIESMVCIDLDSQDQKKDATIGRFNGFDRAGYQTINAPMHYKDILGVHQELASGRNYMHWIRGGLDESDIVHGKGNAVELKDKYRAMEQCTYINSVLDGEYVQRFRMRPVIDGATGVQAGRTIHKFYGPRAINAHAITRKRFRFQGEGENIFNSIKNQVYFMQDTIEYVNYRYANDGEFTFADVFIRLNAAMAGVDKTYQEIKPYLSDADQKEENGAKPPGVRFGMTGASIIERWSEQAGKRNDDLIELPKTYKPFTNAFDHADYLKKVDADPYLDAIKESVDALTRTVDFDAYNLPAYQGHEPTDQQQPMPDLVIMQL